ncbi:MAG: hypothetical protein HY481_01730 [Candidatus Vogelbacteria bacterium]|nr:hypothetical protein [Candidatus Vogelbacteria bacterium]
MNQGKIAGLIIGAAIIGTLAGYWYGHQSGDITGYRRAQNEFVNFEQRRTAARQQQTADASNPLETVKTNPFENVKFNPFE